MPDGELAWTNVPGVLRIHRQVWRGMIREGEENLVHGRKLHPAQKPVALLTWCVAGIVKLMKNRSQTPFP